MRIAFIDDSEEKLGLEYISAVLKAHNHEVKLFIDERVFDDEYITFRPLSKIFDPKKKIISQLEKYKPDIIGFSVMSAFYQRCCYMAEQIKEKFKVPIIFGGIHPTSVPERVIKNEFVDMICVGEGEYPMLELVNSMEEGQIDYRIKNIWFKKNGRIIANDVRELVDDLDILPMADKEIYYSLKPHYADLYLINTRRGCEYNCSYCCHSNLRKIYFGKGKYLRSRSVKNVIDELEYAKKKYNIKYVRFWDENFACDITWLRNFSKLYVKNIDIPFKCDLYPENVNEETITILKTTGCHTIELGVQTLSDQINREIFNRHISVQKIEHAIDLIKKERIRLETDNIFGVPGQSRDDLIEFIRFYSKRKVNQASFYKLSYFPNTTITNWGLKNGIINYSDYEQIMDGKNKWVFTIMRDDSNKDFSKLTFLIPFIPILPVKVVEWILEAKFYKYFPARYFSVVFAVFMSFYRFLKRRW